jgi:AraC-like DNA-binding protein
LLAKVDVLRAAVIARRRGLTAESRIVHASEVMARARRSRDSKSVARGVLPAPPPESLIPLDAPEPPLGLTIRAARAGDELRIAHDTPAMICPLESAVFEATHRDRTLVIDRSSVLIVPRGCTSLRSISPSGRAAILRLHEQAQAHVLEEYGSQLDREELARSLTHVRLLPRTVWLHELVHRYVFERGVCQKHRSIAARFLELEIPKELYFLARDAERESAKRRSHVEEHGDVVARALQMLEHDLFAPWSVSKLAKRVHASESTLLRAFKRELGVAPSGYLRMRRLDEALLLVKAGRHSIGAIAERVGYSTTAAFDHAFRGRFGAPPSAFAPRLVRCEV